MYLSEKNCSFCAEKIELEAVRCEHCHADLPPAMPGDLSAAQKNGMGWFGKILIFIVGAGALFLAFGAFVSNSPEGQAKAKARNAIDFCHKQEGSYSGSPGERNIISGACRKLENDFIATFGHTP